MKKTICLYLVLLFFAQTSVQALDWAYAFVVWKGNVYEVTDEKVKETQIGKRIGEVKTKPNDMSGRYYGNASNSYPKGTPYHELKDVSTNEAIAVEVVENQWVKAIYRHEATNYWLGWVMKVSPILFLATVLIAIIWRMRKA